MKALLLSLIKSKKSRLILSSTILSVVLIIFTILAFSRKNVEINYAAKVNDTEISFEELDVAVNQKITFFNVKEQSYDESTVRNDSLNNLIDAELIAQYAFDNSIEVNEKELQTLFDSRVANFGSEDRLANEVYRLYGLSIENYKEGLRNDLLREKVQAKVSQQLSGWLELQRSSADNKIDWNI